MTYIHAKAITTPLGYTVSAPADAETNWIKEHYTTLAGPCSCHPCLIAALNYFCQRIVSLQLNKIKKQTVWALECVSWTETTRTIQTDKDKSEASEKCQGLTIVVLDNLLMQGFVDNTSGCDETGQWLCAASLDSKGLLIQAPSKWLCKRHRSQNPACLAFSEGLIHEHKIFIKFIWEIYCRIHLIQVCWDPGMETIQ